MATCKELLTRWQEEPDEEYDPYDWLSLDERAYEERRDLDLEEGEMAMAEATIDRRALRTEFEEDLKTAVELEKKWSFCVFSGEKVLVSRRAFFGVFDPEEVALNLKEGGYYNYPFEASVTVDGWKAYCAMRKEDALEVFGAARVDKLIREHFEV